MLIPELHKLFLILVQCIAYADTTATYVNAKATQRVLMLLMMQIPGLISTAVSATGGPDIAK